MQLTTPCPQPLFQLTCCTNSTRAHLRMDLLTALRAKRWSLPFPMAAGFCFHFHHASESRVASSSCLPSIAYHFPSFFTKLPRTGITTTTRPATTVTMVLLHRLVYPVLLAIVASANLVPRSESDVTTHSMENSTFADICEYVLSWTGMYLMKIAPGAVVYQYADLVSAPKSEDRIVSSAALVSGESGNSQGTAMPIIRMSGPWQHIGELQNEQLYNPIHDALVKMCPYEHGHMGCYSGMRGLPPQVTISDVPYRTNKGNYATNAWVTIKVEASFRELKYPGIGAALVS